MDDEVARSKAKTRPLGGFTDAQRRPGPLLLGLAIGLALAWIPTFLSIVLAPFPSLIVGGVMTLFPLTRAVGAGMVAAACGIAVFLLTGLVLAAIF